MHFALSSKVEGIFFLFGLCIEISCFKDLQKEIKD